MQDLVRIFAVASGRVQGVGFRYFVYMNADRHGVTGWVRNMDDGTVQMELQGSRDKVAVLTEEIKKGNLVVRVDGYEAEQRTPIAGERRFEIRG